jgi:hypothetical protein
MTGATVKVYDGSRLLGTATVTGGTWSLAVALAPGAHSLTATQTVSTYTSVASSSVPVTVYAQTGAPTSVSAPTNVASGVAFTVSGSGAAGDTVTVCEGSTCQTTTVAGNGKWSLSFTVTGTGPHALTATQLNPASGFSSTAVGVTVTAYTQPGAPGISGATVGSVSRGTATVTFTGTGAAGETITLYDGGSAVGTVTVGTGGGWTLAVRLGSGTHSMTATQTLVAGVTSNPSAGLNVTVPSH